MDRKKICILGNYSGRNAGDAAILEGVLREVSSRYDNVEFLVPTLNPEFVRRSYSQYAVTAVSLLPWRGSVKLLGLPVWNAIRSSDLILITDAILFDRHLLNPLQNYLSSLALLIPMAKRPNTPVVLYNVSLGPVTTQLGRWCLRRILDNSDLLILRDEESKSVLDAMGPISIPVLKGADSALSAAPCSPEQIDGILRDEGFTAGTPRVGINLNCYGDAFVRNGASGFSQDKLLSIMSRTAEWIHRELKAEVWLLGTQHMDVGILQDLKERIPAGANVRLLTNQKYDYAELMGLLSMTDLLIGMRTHSVILASSVGTPMIGIVNYPKTYGYLERIGQAQQAIPIQELELERLQNLIRTSWEQRPSLRQEITQAVERERRLAWQAAEFIEPHLSTEMAISA